MKVKIKSKKQVEPEVDIFQVGNLVECESSGVIVLVTGFGCHERKFSGVHLTGSTYQQGSHHNDWSRSRFSLFKGRLICENE